MYIYRYTCVYVYIYMYIHMYIPMYQMIDLMMFKPVPMSMLTSRRWRREGPGSHTL